MNPEKLLSEVKYRTSRSSGAGGQHVNKVETKVDLLFNVEESLLLTDQEKQLLKDRLSSKITKDGILITSSQQSRSQLDNKNKARQEFLKLLKKALTPPKKRKKVKPLVAKKEERLKEKKKHSEKKVLRQKVTP